MTLCLRKILALISLAACTAILAPAAHAGLIGQSVEVSYRFPDTSTPYGDAYYSPAQFTIDADDPETLVNIEDVTFFLVDFTEAFLRIDFITLLIGTPSLQSTSFNGLSFSLLSAAAWPVTVTSLQTDVIGTPLVTFLGNQLNLNLAGIGYFDGAYLQVNFRPVHGTPVSEPPVWSLLILAMLMAALGSARGRSFGAIPVCEKKHQ